MTIKILSATCRSAIALLTKKKRGQPLAEVQSVELVLSSFSDKIILHFLLPFVVEDFCIIHESVKLPSAQNIFYKYVFSAVKSTMLVYK